MPILLKILRMKSKSPYYGKFSRCSEIAEIRRRVKPRGMRQSSLSTHAK